MLASRLFDPRDPESTDPEAGDGAFLEVMPLPDGLAAVVFRKGEAEVGRRVASANAPTVRVVSPDGGESWDGAGPFTVLWDASDLDGDPVVATVLYSADDAASGTFGQHIPGIPHSRMVAGTAAVHLIQLTRDHAYRTNLGFANPGDGELEVVVGLCRGDGGFVGHRTVILPPYAFHQENNVFAGFGHDRVDDGFAVVRSPTEDASYLAYASVVDNRSGDPVYTPARR